MMMSQMRILTHAVLSLFLLAALVATPSYAHADPEGLIVSVDLDGTLIARAQPGQGNFTLTQDGQSYVVNRVLLDLIEILSKNTQVKIVINSGRAEETAKEVASKIKFDPPNSSQFLKDRVNKYYSTADLIPATPEMASHQSFVYDPASHLSPEVRGYKDLEKIARDFKVPVSHVFHFENDGRFIPPGLEPQWIRFPTVTADESSNFTPELETLTAFSEFFSKKLENGQHVWDIVGEITTITGITFRPGSGIGVGSRILRIGDYSDPSPYYLPMPQSKYEATRHVSLDILKNYSPDQYEYLMLGRSPMAIGAMLKNLLPNAVHYLAYSGEHIPGRNNTSAKRLSEFDQNLISYRKLTQEEEERLFDYFDSVLPSVEALAGRKLLIVDYCQYLGGMESFLAYFQLYRERRNYKGDIEVLVIPNKPLPFKAPTELSGTKIKVQYYGNSASALTEDMKASLFEDAAPYGRFLPSKDQSPDPNKTPPLSLIFENNLYQSMKADPTLPELVGPKLMANFLNIVPVSQEELAQAKAQLLNSKPQYIRYQADYLNSLSKEERLKYLKKLWRETPASEMRYLFPFILSGLSSEDRILNVPLLARQFEKRKGLYDDDKNLWLLVRLYPEYMMSSQVMSIIASRAYNDGQLATVLDLFRRIPNASSRDLWLKKLLEEAQARAQVQSDPYKVKKYAPIIEEIKLVLKASQPPRSAIVGRSCKAVVTGT
jgi:hypothetical protein